MLLWPSSKLDWKLQEGRSQLSVLAFSLQAVGVQGLALLRGSGSLLNCSGDCFLPHAHILCPLLSLLTSGLGTDAAGTGEEGRRSRRGFAQASQLIKTFGFINAPKNSINQK